MLSGNKTEFSIRAVEECRKLNLSDSEIEGCIGRQWFKIEHLAALARKYPVDVRYILTGETGVIPRPAGG